MSSPATVGSAYEELNSLSRATYAIGNAGDEVIERQVNGKIYRWEPWEVLKIKDQMDYPRDGKGNIPRDRHGDIEVEPSLTSITALNIVRAIFSDEDGFRGGEFGLYLERGDSNDSARKSLARESYIRMRLARGEKKQADWVELVQNRKPGDPPLVAPKHLRDDIKFMADHRAGLIDKKAFWSTFGDFESDDRDEVVNYIRSAWPAQWKRDGEALVVARDEMAVPVQAVKAARPSASAAMRSELQATPAVSGASAGFDIDQLKFINDQAKELGTALSPDELAAIMSDDEAGIDAMMTRLAEIKKSNNKG